LRISWTPLDFIVFAERLARLERLERLGADVAMAMKPSATTPWLRTDTQRCAAVSTCQLG